MSKGRCVSAYGFMLLLAFFLVSHLRAQSESETSAKSTLELQTGTHTIEVWADFKNSSTMFRTVLDGKKTPEEAEKAYVNSPAEGSIKKLFAANGAEVLKVNYPNSKTASTKIISVDFKAGTYYWRVSSCIVTYRLGGGHSEDTGQPSRTNEGDESGFDAKMNHAFLKFLVYEASYPIRKFLEDPAAAAVQKGEQALTEYLEKTFNSPALSRLLRWNKAVSNLQSQVKEAEKRLNLIQAPALDQHAKIMQEYRREIESSMISAVSAFNELNMEERGVVLARQSSQYPHLSAADRRILAELANDFHPTRGFTPNSGLWNGIEGEMERKRWDDHVKKLRDKLAVKQTSDGTANPFEVSRFEVMLAKLTQRKMLEAKAKAESWIEEQVGEQPRQQLFLTQTTEAFRELSPERQEELREKAKRAREAALKEKIDKWSEKCAEYRSDPRYKDIVESWKDDSEIRDLTKQLQAIKGGLVSDKKNADRGNPFAPTQRTLDSESTQSDNPFVPSPQTGSPAATPSGNPFDP